MDTVARKNLLPKFHQAMLGIYETSRIELKYNSIPFKKLVVERGGFGAACYLLDSKSDHVSNGFTELALRQRLDLSVESLILQDAWIKLFSEQQIKTAKHRLREHHVK